MSATNFFNSYLLDRELSKKHSDTQTLILGDSHARWINEIIIPNSANLFQGGDTYKASYYKLAKMIEVAHQLDTVIIAYDYHNLGELYSNKIQTKKESIKRISQLATIREMATSTTNYPKLIEVTLQQKLTFYFKSLFNVKAKYTFDDDKNYHTTQWCKENHPSNNYLIQKTTDSLKIHKKITSAKSYYFESKNGKMGYLTVDYLEQMLKLCKDNNIKCYLISIPIDPHLAKITPKKFKQKFDEIITEFKSEYDFEYINFRSAFDDRIELLENPDHISEYGGAILSEKLMLAIRSKKN